MIDLQCCRDTIASGKGLCNTTLVEVLANQSAAAHDFLTFFGVDLSSVTKLGGEFFWNCARG